MRLRKIAYLVAMSGLLVAPLSAFAAKPPPPPPANPVVTSISSYGQEAGTQLVITGTGFGPKKEANYPVFAGVRGGVVEWADTRIVARVPNTAGPGYVGVQVDGVISNGKYFVPGTPPVLTSVSTQGAEAGQQVTITGADFGATQDIGWATVSGVSAEVVSWSDTQVVLESPGSAQPGWIGIWQNAICSNGKWFVAGGLPEISSVSSTIARPGDTITIDGKHFGAAPESSEALRWGSITITPLTWSNSQITFRVPDDAASGYLGIVRDGVVSNGVKLDFGGRIDSLSNWWGAPNTNVTITGVGFGNTADRVTFAGTDGTIVSWSPTRIVARIPEGAAEGNVGVWRGGVASNGVWFLPAHRPQIAGISPVAASPGETVTVSGSSFGATPTAESALTFDGVRLTPLSWTDTEVTFAMPAGTGSGYVGVSRFGLTSNGVLLHPRALITSISSWWGPPGTQITIDGNGFGDSADRVSFGGIDAPIVSWTDTRVVATVPAGAIEGPIGVWRGAFASNGVHFVPIARPEIAAVSTERATPGDLVTLSGTGFGSAPDGPDALTLGTTPVTPDSWSDTQITFTVPEGVSSAYLGVNRRGLTSNGAMLYIGPRISSLSSWWGVPGTLLTIDGAGFGDTVGVVEFSGSQAAVESWSRTRIVVTIPDAAEGNVVVTVNGTSSEGAWFLPMFEPQITGVDLPEGSPGAVVTIDGQHFGDTQGSSVVTLAGSSMTVVSWSDTQVVVSVPAGATSGYLGVTKRGITSNGRWFNVLP